MNCMQLPVSSPSDQRFQAAEASDNQGVWPSSREVERDVRSCRACRWRRPARPRVPECSNMPDASPRTLIEQGQAAAWVILSRNYEAFDFSVLWLGLWRAVSARRCGFIPTGEPRPVGGHVMRRLSGGQEFGVEGVRQRKSLR